MTLSFPFPHIPKTIFSFPPHTISVNKNIPIPSRNNILFPIPFSALSIRNFELVMITQNKVASH